MRVRELEDAGVDRRTISRRCSPDGPWTRVVTGAVKLDNGPVTRDDRRAAAVLLAGPGAVVTGADALALHSVRTAAAPHGPVHVLIPHDRRRASGAVLCAERTRRLPAAAGGRFPLAPVARAALDTVRRSRDRDLVRTLFADLVQHGHCTLADLITELANCSSRGTAMPRTVLAEMTAGVRSVAEADARALLRTTGLPGARHNVSLRDRTTGELVAVVDVWFDDVGMAWEIDSIEFHLGPADYARTVRRRSDLSRAGVVVVQSLPSDVRRRSASVVDELCRSYERAALLPRPDLVADPD
ncbi:hypothetical protein [Pseudonocardia phyllosphaerae]|uniref:hypothetical protein n=1 Tax=Pseudonocardia phyllosphaerae TaxID=3390502 RepID=UPI00397B46E3